MQLLCVTGEKDKDDKDKNYKDKNDKDNDEKDEDYKDEMSKTKLTNTSEITKRFKGLGQIRSMNFPRGHFGINDISPFRASLSSHVHQNGPCFFGGHAIWVFSPRRQNSHFIFLTFFYFFHKFLHL